MYAATLLIGMLVAYLAGSINFAVPISRWAKGIDIRTIGSRNPGTANVGREVGKGWAALVFLGDLAKGLLPLILARFLIFPDDHYSDFLALFLIGMMAITGHCWPVFHQFRGGGGLATSIGIFMFFIPVEFFLALLVSFLLVQVLFRRKRWAFGQLIPMFFIPLAPLFVVLSSLWLNMELRGFLKLGGHPWYIILGVALMSFYILIINIRTVKGRFSQN
jgi:acyl-phosphate glycerol 3-phosphate acyltransferase